jgi:hypothetical protein
MRIQPGMIYSVDNIGDLTPFVQFGLSTWESRLDGISGHWAEGAEEDLRQARQECADWESKCPTAAKLLVESADRTQLWRIRNEVLRASYERNDSQGHPSP